MRLVRRARLAGILSLCLFSAASPTAAADYSEFSPAADNPCGVDVLIEADFLPTDRMRMGSADITFTNLENRATYLQRSRHLDSWTFDASTETWHGIIRGRIWTPLYPGEPGPSGVVQEPGLWILTKGKLEYSLDENDVLSDFSLEGEYYDLCALLGA